MTTQRTWRWLALFVLVDLVLVAVMLRHVSGDDDSASAAPSSAEPAPTDEPAPPATPVPAGLVEATGDTVVWGARGSCSAGVPVTLGRVVDGRRDDLDPGVTELLRLDVNDAGDVYVVGADAQCAVVELLLAEGTTEWVDPSGPVRRWHLTPGAAGVTTPAGDVDPGCPVVSLVSEGPAGLVGCDDGSIRTSDDDGGTWEGEAVLEGLRSLARADDGIVALAPADGCAVGAHRVEGDAITPIGCVSETGGDGLVLVTTTGDGYAAVVGETLLRSTDGSAWEPVTG